MNLPPSWIDPELDPQMYTFPDLSRWGITTMERLMTYHPHEIKDLVGMPKKTAKTIIQLMERLC